MILLAKFVNKPQILPLRLLVKASSLRVQSLHTTQIYNSTNDEKKSADDVKKEDKKSKPQSQTGNKLKSSKLNRFTKLIEVDKVKKTDAPHSGSSSSSSQPTLSLKFDFKPKQQQQQASAQKQSSQKSAEQQKKEENSARKIAKLVDKKNPEKEAEILLRPIKLVEQMTSPKSEPPTVEEEEIELTLKNDSELTKLLNQVKLQDDKEALDYDTDKIRRSSFLSGDAARRTRRRTSDESSAADNRELSPFEVVQTLQAGKGLYIFVERDETTQKIQSHLVNEKPVLESPIWTRYATQELNENKQTVPTNGFDEAILLTERGQLWRFPIDNEQDVDEKEARVPFYEHVLLDQFLSQFPQIEPIQQFMTIVLNGLSQNSFLSVTEKHEVINWYKSYFNDKLDIIKEALETEKMEELYLRQGEKVAENASVKK